MAGGLRTGSARPRSAGCPPPTQAAPTSSSAPVVAAWEGRILGAGPSAGHRAAARRRGLPARAVRPARRARRRGHARPRRSRTPTCCSPAAARTSSSCGSAARATWRSSRPAAGSSRRSRRRARRARTTSPAHGRRWLDEMLGHGTTTIEAKSGYGLDLPDGAAPPRGRPRARQGGAGRRRPDVSRRACRAARVPRPPRRRRGLRPERHRRAAPRRRGPGQGPVLRRVLRGGRVHGRAVGADPGAPARRSGWCPRLHADELVPSGGAELAAAIGAASADHLAAPSEAGIDALADAAADGRPVVATRAARDDVVPDEAAPRAGPDVHRAGHPGRDRDRLQPGHVADAVAPAGDDGRLPEPGADAGRGAGGGDDQRGLCGRAGRRGRVDRGRQEPPTSSSGERPDVPPDPVLAGRGPGPDGGQARPDRRSTRAGTRRLLPRDSRRTAVVSAGRLEIVTDSCGWGVGSPPISWKNFARASRHLRRVLVQRHRDDDPGIELGDELGGLRRRQRAADRDAGDVDRADVGELLLGQEVADLAEVDRVQPVELDEERRLLAALGALRVVAVGPDARQEDVADLVLAGAVEDERLVERARQDRLAVTRALALGLRQRPVVRVRVGDDLAGDAATGRPDDRLIGSATTTASCPEAGCTSARTRSIPCADSDIRRCTPDRPTPIAFAQPDRVRRDPLRSRCQCWLSIGATSFVRMQLQRWPGQPIPDTKTEAPAQSAPRSEGGRMEPKGVRSESNPRRAAFTDGEPSD